MDAERRKRLARLRVGHLAWYVRDLEAHAAGDTGRFTRMVDGRGQQLGSEQLWRRIVAHGLTDGELWAYCKTELWDLKARAEALGIESEVWHCEQESNVC